MTPGPDDDQTVIRPPDDDSTRIRPPLDLRDEPVAPSALTTEHVPERAAESYDTDGTDAHDTDTDEKARTAKQMAATLLMASGTLASRLLGFVRAMLIAIVLGNGTRQVEMFSLANTVPNMIYVLLAGGVLNTVFVPQIVRAIKKHADGGEAYTNRILTAFLVILAAVTVAATLAAPLIVDVYVNVAWQAPELAMHHDNIVMLTYLCLPQLFFYGVHVLVGQVLNAREKYGPMMWSPIANNVIAIAVFALYLVVWGSGNTAEPFTPAQVWVLGGGATLGIIVQALILVPFMKRAGFVYRPRFDLRGTGLGHTFSLARWTLLFVLATQLGLVVITRLASSAPADGSGAGWHAYNQAYLLWILPHSLVTVSLTTAMLTSASARAAHHDLAGVAAESMRTMRLALTALLPMAVAFLALGLPITELLFGNGEGAEDARFLGWTLMALAVGLVPFTLNYVCQRTFYALEDTRSPFLQQVIVVVLNVGFALLLVLPFRAPAFVAPALGLAYSLAYAIGFGISFGWLKRRLPHLDGNRLRRLAVRLLIAVAPGAVLAYVVCTILGAEAGQLVRAGLLAGSGIIAVGSFIGLSRLFHITEVTEIISTLRRRRPAGGDDGDGDGGDGGPDGGGAGGGPGDDGRPAVRGRRFVDEGNNSVADPDRSGAAAGPNADGTPSITPVAGAGSSVAGPGFAGAQDTETSALAEAGGMRLETGRHAASHGSPDSTVHEAVPTDESPTGDTEQFDATEQFDRTGPYDDMTALQPVSAIRDDVASGTVLGSRYRLEEQMELRHEVTTWRAFDAVLSRSVVIHLLPAGDPRAAEVLASARRAAIATDSRFLRVLDAVESNDDEHGSYVVCEYSPGQNLTTLLAGGPLSALEAAWVVREVADAMAGVHALDLYHLRISPDTVWITPTGNVKIGDMAIRAELRPGAELDPSDPATLKRGRTAFQPETPEAHDVADLGRLLYACLVHRWPGGHRYGMEAAPVNGADGWLTPRQVRHGVSPALDRICDQILTARPRQGDSLRSATEIVTALTRVLGTADASGDLERRLQQPVPQVVPEEGEPIVPTETPLETYYAQANTDRHGPASPETPTGALTAATTEPPSGRRWLLGAIIVLLAILLIAIIAVAAQLQRSGDEGPTTTPTAESSLPPAEPTVHTITGGIDFDPQGDGREENRERVPLAYDKNPETGWTTDRYRGNPAFGGLGKDGVGIVVDLGSPVRVSQVKLLLANSGADLEVLVPKEGADSITEPPLASVEDWRSVAQQAKADEELTVELSEPETTRFVLVMFTSLAPDGGNNYRAGVNEIEVSG
ncbi:murein biosynthesis integral membrane protein MurJ [Microlunatus sp. Y2014]|uniref:murein biosynthesis integral membrane protein MurJ n=1 Tax=Microlunatus sp. Y2014 TaxID=3418488 RepID=UPI003DA77271